MRNAELIAIVVSAGFLAYLVYRGRTQAMPGQLVPVTYTPVPQVPLVPPGAGTNDQNALGRLAALYV